MKSQIKKWKGKRFDTIPLPLINMSFQKGLSIGLNYFLAYLLIKFGSKEIYGDYISIFSLLMIASVILKFGYDLSYTKWLGQKNEATLSREFLKVDLSIFLISTLLTVVLLMIYESKYYMFLFSIPFYTVMLVNSGKLRGIGRASSSFFFNVLGRVLLLMIGILVLIALFKNISFQYFSYVYIGAVIGLFIVSIREVVKYIRIKEIPVNLSSFNRTNVPIALSTIIFILALWGDRYVLGWISDSETVANYDLGLKVAMIMNIITEITSTYFSPKYSHSSEDSHQLQKFINQATKINVGIGALLTVAIIILAKYALSIFQIHSDLAYHVCIIFTLGYFISSLFGPVLNIIQMTGLMKKFLPSFFIILLICFGLGLIAALVSGDVLYIAIGLAMNMIMMSFAGSKILKKEKQVNSLIQF